MNKISIGRILGRGTRILTKPGTQTLREIIDEAAQYKLEVNASFDIEPAVTAISSAAKTVLADKKRDQN